MTDAAHITTAPEDDAPRPTVLETWRDDAGKLWAAITGKRRVWLLGDVTPAHVYPRLAVGARIIELAMVGAILLNVIECARLLRALLSMENIR